MKGILQHLVLLGSVLCLLACAGNSAHAPVVERQAGGDKTSHSTGRHTVVAGDTLYSISWRYGLDFKELAKLNKIHAPYTIRPGQVLLLKALANAAAGRPASSGTSRKGRSDHAASARKSAKIASKQAASIEHASWRWPAKGTVIRFYSESGNINKGIDIGGRVGDPVFSTRAGTVVYAGNGLAGYGNLVIVKHSSHYLSAYAHNRQLFVKEGQQVQAGVKIAEIGSSGSAKQTMLHFEIRYDGKPVNPLKLLPKR